MNVLDLRYFSSIQSLQYRRSLDTVIKLVQATVESFVELDSYKLNDIFLTLQICMEQTIINDSGNNYKIRHINKRKLERENRLPVSIVVSNKVMAKLNERD